ncbi:transcription factor S-II, central domain-containing protein [Lipomyces orientalis]|uniref:Transcription factor S-II, central domain-containing protein n=1 Tax=Lipomyces orientalis TaxID=1233043 RepID=A0ACC3THI3_9ASCO
MASTEPRRSSRSTKGQHSQTLTQELEVVDMKRTEGTSKTAAGKSEMKRPKAKSRRMKKQSTPEEEGDEESYVRCVCGLEVTDPDDDKPLMAQCEECLCWQHPECTMGITVEADVPDQYFCERCRPDLHGAYFQRIAQEEKEEKPPVLLGPNDPDYKPKADGQSRTVNDLKSGKRKLERSPSVEGPLKIQKKDRHGSASERTDTAISEKFDQQEDKPQPPPPRTVTNLPPLSRRKSSASTVPKAVPLPSKVDHIYDLADNVRKSVANGILKLLEKTADEAISNDTLQVDEGTTAVEFAEKLSLEIEYSMYEQLAIRTEKDVGHKYRDKFRTILFNLKDIKNSVLRQKVLSGDITPEHLVRMTPEEMMNPELQKLAEAVRAESITQSILKKPEAPRIRRTHKGEEFVGDVDPMGTVPEAAPEREEEEVLRVKAEAEAQVSPNANDNPHHQRSVSPFTTLEQNYLSDITHPDDEKRERSQSLQLAGARNSEDRRSATPSADSAVADNEDFNIDQVWKSVDSPPADMRSSVTDSDLVQPISPPPQSRRQVIDEDIDRLITDELDHNAMPEDDFDNSYSPMLEPKDPMIWEGLISMAGVSEFMGSAVQVGGPLFDGELRRWQDVIAPSIDIDGRLSKETAASYLSEVSSTKDLVAVSFTVMDSNSKEQERAFTRLFDYFRGRDRYGVIRNKFPNVKDAYLVPLLPADPRPEYMHMISSISIPRIVTTPMLLGIFVINKANTLARATAGDYVTNPDMQGESDEYDPTAIPMAPSTSSDAFGHREPWYPPVAREVSSFPLQSSSGAIASPAPNLDSSGPLKSVTETLLGLALPPNEVGLLQKILASSPEVTNDPSLINDPNFLIKIVQDYQRNHS